jgi:hypothetical protein
MARQCQITTSQFKDFAECRLSQEQYEIILKASGYFSRMSKTN